MTAHRLAAPAGAWIDRTRPVGFTFDGRSLSGFAGDTLASALLANGVRLVGRSFKLHRPRGVWSAGTEEPCALVDTGEGARYTPNVRATLLPLTDGLVARSINRWPSLGFDLGAINDRLSRLLPSGFYYKTFKWPSWAVYEGFIRRMAGLGRAPRTADPDRYEELSVACDVLVVGGGVAGLAAAGAAARAGAHTVLVSAGEHLGGARAADADPEVQALAAAARAAGVRIATRVRAFGVYDHNLVCACEAWQAEAAATDARTGVLRERTWKIRAGQVIAATGAFERPLLFPDNDRPGVMLAIAAARYAAGWGVACGRRAVIAAGSDHAYAIAARLRAAGIGIAALVDWRESAGAEADIAGVPVIRGRITAVAGRRGVSGCRVVAHGHEGRGQWIDCDLVLNAGGLAPAVHLHSQAGGKLNWDPAGAMFVPAGPAPGLVSVGACAGVFTADAAVAHAQAVGTALARGAAPPGAPVGGFGVAAAIGPVDAPGKQFVDLQNDVAASDVALAARESYRSVEHLKRYTTTGMGTDQGKTANVNALVLLGSLSGRVPPEVGTTRFRPPFVPVTLGAIAGRRAGTLYRPIRELPASDWHAAHGALFELFGDWRRPAAYPRAGETLEAAAIREAAAVRRTAGLYDGSTLGKLEVFGPDAARFLDHMYVGTMSTLAVGQARYGVMLSEQGALVDDGIVARLGEQHFWVNTTTSGVERTAATFEEWLQCEYTSYRVLVTPVTSRWATVTVAGPKAWEWLARAGFDTSLAPGSMAHMTLRASELGGVPLRILRASFSGELGYEINLPAGEATGLFERLWACRDAVDATLYGIEALMILRTEKGYLHIGADTDGTTLPADVGFARGIERKKADFVGRRSLSRPVARDPERFELVGLVPRDRASVLHVGAHIAAHAPPAPIDGRVTSACFSPALGHPIALALLRGGFKRKGEQVTVYYLGRPTAAEVVSPVFVDPEGRRVHG